MYLQYTSSHCVYYSYWQEKKEKERQNITFSNYIFQKDLEKTSNPPIKSIAATRLILFLLFSSLVLNLQL